MALIRQIWALTSKNIRIVLLRLPLSTIFRAFVLPVVFAMFLSYAQILFEPPAYYGIANSSPVKSVPDAMREAKGGRDTLAFVNNGFFDGDIQRVIETVAEPVRAIGKTVRVLQTPEELVATCPSTLRGDTTCFAAVIFHSSPNEGPGGIWNYTLRGDGLFGTRIDIRKSTNDAELYIVPVQHAVDFSIASLNGTIDASALPSEVRQYPYTDRTREQRIENIRIRYMGGITNVIAVVFYLLVVGVMYQMVGFAAYERESGMSSLIEAMMPNLRRWQPQAARLASYHFAFHNIYAPGWVLAALILGFAVFEKTSKLITVVFFVLAGLAVTSFAIFGASFFKKAQLSGISCTIASILMAILAQVVSKSGSGTVAILGLLFPPANFVFFMIFMARYERKSRATNLVEAAPDSPWGLPGIVLLFFFVLQILIYPLLGAVLERYLYPTTSKGRKLSTQADSFDPVRLENFSKHYRPGRFSQFFSRFFGTRKETVVAVNDLNLTVRRGQIMALLGANGSGKTTTLEAIAGLSKVTNGTITVDGSSGLGVCPQKNVLWDSLTVEEHIRIFSRLKSAGSGNMKFQINQLIEACDLQLKKKARAGTLSGGQKRKLQLAMMFIGGSRVCCVDEVSSGLDPLSRRKIWDILLRERGERTIILTTHFLDEAELLADHIAILSKGSLKVEGSAVELKHILGGGYRVHVNQSSELVLKQLENIPKKSLRDETIYTVATSAEAAQLMRRLEMEGVADYHVSGPTIEDVFLKVAEEVRSTDSDEISEHERLGRAASIGSEKSAQGLQLLSGRRIGMLQQAWVLFRKRITIVRNNPWPYYCAFIIPVVAAGLVTVLLDDFELPGCSPGDNLSLADIESFVSRQDLNLTVGPVSKLSLDSFARFRDILPDSPLTDTNTTALTDSIHFVQSLGEFNDYIKQNIADVIPGGVFVSTLR